VTGQEISDRIAQRLDDDPASPASFTAAEVLSAINEGQQVASLLTLCIERSATLTIPAATPLFEIRAALPDFLVPLRVSIDGVRIRPATLADLDARDETWQATTGTPTRYFTRGFNLLGVSPQPSGAMSTTAEAIYAAAPNTLTASTSPEMPEAYHQSLVDYGCYRVKAKEGGQGLQRGLGYLNRFLDDMTKLGNFVRTRSKSLGNDVLPFELQAFDRSRLIGKLLAKA
jgi:hypothetical protein